MKLNAGLNLDNLPENTETGDYRYAENITLDNSFQYPINEDGLVSLGITIPSICGIIAFDKGFVVFSEPDTITVVKTNFATDPKERIEKKLILTGIGFTKDNPIRGTYTYNQNGHLIICFSSGVNGNFEDKIIDVDYYSTTHDNAWNGINYTLSSNELYKLNITPDVQFPYITASRTSGNLKTGSYQIAVAYKLDKDYTKFSLLSIPEYIYGSEKDGLKPNVISQTGLEYTLSNLDTHYKYFRVAIIYNDGTTFITYISKDLKIPDTAVSPFKLTDISIYNHYTLDEVLYQSIFYSNSESLAVMNNRLYRANVKGQSLMIGSTHFDDVAQQIATECTVELKESILDMTNVSKGSQIIKFQNEEAYALFLTFGDKKGNILGSYPLRSLNTVGNIATSTKASTYTTEEIKIDNPITVNYGNDANTPTVTLEQATGDAYARFGLAEPLGFMNYGIKLDAVFQSSIHAINFSYDPSNTGVVGEDVFFKYQLTYKNTSNQVVTVIFDDVVPAGWSTYVIEIGSIVPDYSFDASSVVVTSLNTRLYVDPAATIPSDVAFDYNFTLGYAVVSNVSFIADEIEKYVEVEVWDGYSVTATANQSNDFVLTVSVPRILEDTQIGIEITDGMNGEEIYEYVTPSTPSFSRVLTGYNGNIRHRVITHNTNILTVSLSVGTPLSIVTPLRYEFVDINNKIKRVDFSISGTTSNSVEIQLESAVVGTLLYSDFSTDFYQIKYTFPSPTSILSSRVLAFKYPDADYTNGYTKTYNIAKNLSTFTTESFQKPLKANNGALIKWYTPSQVIASDTVSTIAVFYSNNAYYEIGKENLTENTSFNYTQNYIEVTLPSNVNSILGVFANTVGFWCIHRAVRTSTNCRIYTQGIGMGGLNQSYDGDSVQCSIPTASNIINIIPVFEDNGTRFYSFEDLFNKSDYFSKGSLDIISKYKLKIDTQVATKSEEENNQYNSVAGSDFEKTFRTTYFFDTSKVSLKEANNYSIGNGLAENTRVVGTTGLASNITSYFYQPTIIGDTLYYNNSRNVVRINALTGVSNYYENFYNENLVLASGIKRISDNKNNAYGDTFYSRFALRLVRTYGDIPFGEIANPSYIDPRTRIDNFVFFVESKYNVHARYWQLPYPKYDLPIITAEQKGYDKVYHSLNNQNVTSTIDIANNDERKESNLYPTRIIMSNKSNAEKNILAFRKYDALDYYDMPYTRNAIVAIMTTYKNLYIQQELGCFIASVKDVISYQEGSTYVGSGELFDRIPTELIPTPYGFVGCESYFNTSITDKGLIVIDNVQGLIFFITDEGISIISEGKNKNWLKDNLGGNNPFKGEGCYITYDNNPKVKRMMLSISKKQKTLSFIPEIKNWLSFHFYNFVYGCYTRNGTYFFNSGGTFYKYDSSIKGKLSTSTIIRPAVLSLYFNEEPNASKLFETIYWNTKVLINKVSSYDTTFTNIFVHNDSQCTPLLTIDNSSEWFDVSGGTMKREIWMFNKLFDYVLDNHKPFLSDFLTFIDTNMVSENKPREWFEISKIMGTFVAITFTFDNKYYSLDGSKRSVFKTTECAYQPDILLKDLTVQYKQDNR